MKVETVLKNRAIFFTTDYGFLIPTLVSAQQILQQEDVENIADILIYLVDYQNEEYEKICREFPKIRFFMISSSQYELPLGATFNVTHVPKSTLARLVVASDFPEQYDHLVYIDGDTQITGSIFPLVKHDVAIGSILASCDRPYIIWHENRKIVKNMRIYLSGLGIYNPEDYFNAGVIAATRSTWASLGANALKYFVDNSADCLYHDQSAINAISLGRREVLSPKYNFVSSYADMGAADYLEPSIIHFTGGSKPWFSNAAPWYGRFKHHYEGLLSERPWLRRYWKVKPWAERLESDLRASLAILVVRVIMPWIAIKRRRQIKRYLRETRFAVA